MSTKNDPTCCGTAMNIFLRSDGIRKWQCDRCHSILSEDGEKYRPWKHDEVPTTCILKSEYGVSSKWNMSPSAEKMWGSFDVCHLEDRGSVPTINILKFFTMMDGSPCGVKITSETKETDVKSKKIAKKSAKEEQIDELNTSLRIVTRQREEALRSLKKVEETLALTQATATRLYEEVASLRRDLVMVNAQKEDAQREAHRFGKLYLEFMAENAVLHRELHDLRQRVLAAAGAATKPAEQLSNTSRDGRCWTCSCMTEYVNGKQVCPHCDEQDKNRKCPVCGQRRYWRWSGADSRAGKWFCNVEAHNYPEPAVKETPQHPCAEKVACKQSGSSSESVATGKVCADCGSYMGRLPQDKWYCYNKVCPSYADKSREKEAQSQHPFSGKLKCAECGKSMAWVSPGKWHCDNGGCPSHVGKCFRCGVAIGEKANLQYKVVDGNAYCAHCMNRKYGKVIPITYPPKDSKASDKSYVYCALCRSSNRYTVLDGRVECACCLPYPLKGEGKSFDDARAELQNNIDKKLACSFCKQTVGKKSDLNYTVVEGNIVCSPCMYFQYEKVIPLSYKQQEKDNAAAKSKEEKPVQFPPTVQVWTDGDGTQYRPWTLEELPMGFHATPNDHGKWYKFEGEAWTQDGGKRTMVKMRGNGTGFITVSTADLLRDYHGNHANHVLGVKLEVKPTTPPKEAKPVKEEVSTDKYAANLVALNFIKSNAARELAIKAIKAFKRTSNATGKDSLYTEGGLYSEEVKQCHDWAKRNHKSFKKVFGAALDGII